MPFAMLPDVDIEFETVDGAVVAHVAGEIDMLSARDFVDKLVTAPDSRVLNGSVVLDLSGVSFFSSSGVRALLTFCDRRGSDAPLVRVVVTPTAQQVLSITGVDHLVTVTKTVDEALADLRIAEAGS